MTGRVFSFTPAKLETVPALVQHYSVSFGFTVHSCVRESAIVTSLPPDQLNAAQWLADNRSAWGIENGLHLRLDVSHLDDQCRVRLPKSMRVVGMLRRFSNSLFMHWRTRQTMPKHKTTTDFFTAMNAEHHRYAIRCLHARQPSFRTAS
jgi:hypothetical protein